MTAHLPNGAGAGMRTPGISYGADYNPEQWHPDTLDEDIERMHEAGVTVVTVGVFSWALLEPRPDEFDFGWLRRVMDRLHAAGIGVDLATATASPPPWMGALWRDTLPVTAEGVTLAWGSRQQYNPSSSRFRHRVGVFVSRLAVEFAHHPALVAWHVGNEYGCHVWESFDDESAEAFRGWLRAKYDTLGELNVAWGTAFWSQRYGSWSEIMPPRVVPALFNPHQLDDWREFSSDALLDLFLIERDILKAANPSVPITTNYMGLYIPVDYWKWSQHLDFLSNDTYPDPADPRAAREYAFDCDLMRSLGRGKPFVQMEQVTTGVQWRPRNATKRPGQYGLWSLAAVARGADGILNFQWRQSLAGSESFHGAMLPHSGRASHSWREVVELGSTLAALADVREQPVQSDIAILWDWKNAWSQQHAVGPTNEPAPENGARAWHATLYEMGHLVDLAHPEDDLTPYRVIIVPSLFRLTSAAAARIEEARSSGAHLIVTYLTGYVNEVGHVYPDGYLGLLRDTVGARVVDISPRGVDPVVLGHAEELDPTTDRISAHISAPAAAVGIPLSDASGTLTAHAGHSWAESVIIEPDTEIIAVFAAADVDGQPAITRRTREVGGAAWYVATDLDSAGRHSLAQRVLTDAAIAIPTLPNGVERVRRGDVEFFFNHADHEVSLPQPDGVDISIGPRQAHMQRRRTTAAGAERRIPESDPVLA